MKIADENGLEFLDLKLKMNENGKITVDVFSKPTNLTTCLVHAIHPIISTMYLEGLLWDSNAYVTVMKSLPFVAMCIKIS